MKTPARRDTNPGAGRDAETTRPLTCVREECAKAPGRDTHHREGE